MTRLVLKDELLDAQLLRAIGAALYGGADVGECLAAARAVSGTDLGSWHDAWAALARSCVELAENEQRSGRVESARLAYLRASNYYRTAGVMLMGVPLDPRLKAANAAQTDMFRRAAALMDLPPEILAIPFEDTTLPGYFFRAHDDSRKRATVIVTGGYDGTAEELYFSNGAAALARGYHVLAFDGPGQGSALLQQGLTLRPDWEMVIGAVVDYAEGRTDVDPQRIALIGLSLGAHLAPRAASGEHRLAAVVADCGAFDLGASALERLPPPLAKGLAANKRSARIVLAGLLRLVMRRATAGWALRRGLLVHGVRSPLAFIESLPEYTLVGRAELITCPTWVCYAEGDDISASAPELVAALRCPKELVRFTAAEGADDHCEQGARALYHARSFGWLDSLLHPTETGA
jgi:alpha-beta hydrolase superfamily lysophospholipase